MAKLLHGITCCLVLTIITSGLIILPGCARQNNEGFAVYLTKNDIPPAQMEIQSHVILMDEPIISGADINTYNTQTHEIRLTAAAFERLSQLEVPVRGKSFLVCVDKQPIYWGAFWTPVSSMSFDGVTIWKPYSLQEPYIITLELGYPSSSYYEGQDPRNNDKIIGSLEKSGKLINGLTIYTVTALPESMKGYELYSWLDRGEWHFNLITGTNRNKSLNEIVYETDYISETGWVNIHVTGFDAIKTALSELPVGEDVFWMAGPHVTDDTLGEMSFGFPPETNLNDIKDYAAQHGLNLNVFGD